jgi:molybdopterin-containing oxidoreductase family iron-sulfur binding subunit
VPPIVDHAPSAPPPQEWGTNAFWRSLEERAGDPEFERWLAAEFPDAAPQGLDPVSRRHFLKLAAASLALAGLTGCQRFAPEDIVPGVHAEHSFTPGRAEHFSTALACGPDVLGVIVKSNMGRPTKLEGNPQHPASLGAASAFAQAEILTLYDPHRTQAVAHGERISTWSNFRTSLQGRLDDLREQGGDGLCLVTPPIVSPTLRSQLRRLLEVYPQARWYVHDPLDNDAARVAAEIAFGRSVTPVYRFDRADRILALDCDFLYGVPGSLRYARDFADRRRAGDHDQTASNRLYVAEPCPTTTGSRADHRLPLRAADVLPLACAIAAELGVLSQDIDEHRQLDTRTRHWAQIVSRDLRQHAGAAIVLAGRSQPAAVHALCWAMNHVLNSFGKSVEFIQPDDDPQPVGPLAGLTKLIDVGGVNTLIMLDVNPAYDAPADLHFPERLAQAPFSVHAGLYVNETARGCTWRLPLTHALETWSDAVAYDGTVSIVQPLILPLYSGKSPHELLAMITEEIDEGPQSIIRRHWQNQYGGDDFERWWRDALRSGVIAKNQPATVNVQVDRSRIDKLMHDHVDGLSQSESAESLELRFQPDNTVWDGRYAPNGWLQELPDPITKLTWGNAALLSPATAHRLQVKNEDIITLDHAGQTLEAPVWIIPGHADNSVTLPLGYGHSAGVHLGGNVGFNAYAVRTSQALWFDQGLRVSSTHRRAQLATTQHHHAMAGRDIVRVATAGAATDGQERREHGNGLSVPLSLYPERAFEGPQWGMVIDLARCTGCNACMVACQAENNVPIVGADQVRRGREMHWLRIDRYFEGGPENPAIHHQPIPCMHCENAPCEVVCPTAATAHSHDGLNEMTYNRCVGTRYCSNNCPYKVRRFNFYDYVDRTSPTLKMQRNPDVTVRSRGVMEKCTYCVQRIRTVGIEARLEDRPIRDGEVLTACQQVCPAQAIVFGDINDAQAKVTAARSSAHHYGLLTELNTRPRTTYLAALRNPNPEFA